jgi:hypothetical protein
MQPVPCGMLGFKKLTSKYSLCQICAGKVLVYGKVVYLCELVSTFYDSLLMKFDSNKFTLGDIL